MSRRTLTLSAVLFGLVLLMMATPLWAVPPCSWAGSKTACTQACYFANGGKCVSVSVDASCNYHYTCQIGSYSGPCDCSIEEPPPGGGCLVTLSALQPTANSAAARATKQSTVSVYRSASGSNLRILK